MTGKNHSDLDPRPGRSSGSDGNDNNHGQDGNDSGQPTAAAIIGLLNSTAESSADGLSRAEIARALGVVRRAARDRLRALLGDLVDQGEVERVRGGLYCVPDSGSLSAATPAGAIVRPGLPATPPAGAAAPPAKPTATPELPTAVAPGGGRRPASGVSGLIRVHPAGYGFVERDDGEEDVFVPAPARAAALDGDRVLVDTRLGHRGVEGSVREVLARGRARLTGVLRIEGRACLLEPDDPRLPGPVLLDEGPGAARAGQVVLAQITRYPTRPGEPIGARVVQVLGRPNDPRTEVAKVLSCAAIPEELSAEAEAAAARAAAELAPEDLVDRVDLRDLPFLTIDPESARDFDDAVALQPREAAPGPAAADARARAAQGQRLFVAVADVSHYVRPDTVLDREARGRGVSVYLPDRAIPMLPHRLTTGVCSLLPEVDRLAMVARLDLGPSGEVESATLCAAVIRVRARLDYDGVAAALAGDFRGARARYREWAPALNEMQALADKLRRRRRERGALELDLPEARVLLDDDDPTRVRDIQRSRASEEVKAAYGLVEEFMLAANQVVARFFRDRGLDTLYRVHDLPDQERVEAFAAVAAARRLRFDPQALSPQAFAAFLGSLRGRPDERALSYLLLRSLRQATYDVVNRGHFGLASHAYLHFTSPIRRYPDLVVHRLLKRQLHLEGHAAGGGGLTLAPPRASLAEMAVESSAAERRAMEAEREVVDLYRALYMRDRAGEEFEARISGVASFGVFVEIEQPFVEGLVKVDSLPAGGYELDDTGTRLVGRRSGHTFALGEQLRVRLTQASVERRRLDFALAGAVVGAGQPAGRLRQPDGRRRAGGRSERGAGDGVERETSHQAGRGAGHRAGRGSERGGGRGKGAGSDRPGGQGGGRVRRVRRVRR